MRQAVQTLIETVSGWHGISANPHRFGGTEFNVGKVEIGHVHSSGMVDVPFTVALREQLVAADQAELHHLLQDSGWITHYMSADATQATRLLRLSYLHKVSRRHADWLARPLADELAELGFNDATNAIVLR